MTISKKVESIIAGSSFIRKMFEEGARLKQEFGAENVCDFSLGNPNLDPPDVFNKALETVIAETGPMGHGYMPNTGYPHVRRAVADYLSREHGVEFTENEVIMTCGAAGASSAGGPEVASSAASDVASMGGCCCCSSSSSS